LLILPLADALNDANARVASLEAELRASQKAFDTATAAKATADKAHKAALKRAEKAERALADTRKEHAQREEAVVGRLQTISHAAGSKHFCHYFLRLALSLGTFYSLLLSLLSL
jgi:chromosome segregation ATPase